jgi:hypothetical protein
MSSGCAALYAQACTLCQALEMQHCCISGWGVAVVLKCRATGNQHYSLFRAGIAHSFYKMMHVWWLYYNNRGCNNTWQVMHMLMHSHYALRGRLVEPCNWAYIQPNNNQSL